MQESAFKTLLVEDNVDFRQYVGEVLRDRFPSMHVAEVGNCFDALSVLDKETYDLIFMDIKLPDGVGLDLTKVIKSKNEKTVVVILTSNDFPEYQHASLIAGASYFLPKSGSSCQEIIQLIENFLRARIELSALVYH